MTITVYDSGHGISERMLIERYTYLVEFINDYRNHVIPECPALSWPSSQPLEVHEFTAIDGKSQKQRNGFDCGVFSMLNAECLVRSWDHTRISQKSIPFMRLKIIRDIVRFASLSDLSLSSRSRR